MADLGEAGHDQGTTTRNGCCDPRWIITTNEGWLKLVEAIMTFLTFIIVSSFPGSFRAEYEFLIVVATTAWVFVMLHIFLRITHIFEKLPPALTQPLLGMIGCFFASLALVIGAGVVYGIGKAYDFDTLETSGICGFLSALLFFCEGVYFVFRYCRVPEHRAQEKPTEALEAAAFV
ncbi:hypothetical protein AWC38_SpisGene25825 [Stylophora pistillata]|uniref:MARVEL domain-containing protein n=1 Tax=Stylophora pistillata TaxID=50429 RepID=A0A2B4RLK2_STYPI|nr:hypothetical protein AWC38_SpisGene25825 [Stylophora pistillata]